MRLTTCWVSVSAIRNLLNSYFGSFTPLCSQVVRNAHSSSSSISSHSRFPCSCQRQISENNLPNASINRFNRSNVLSGSRRYNTSVLSSQISNNIPPLTLSELTPTSLSTNENDTKMRTRSLDQVVYHLQADLRRKRRIHRADIHNAVELVEEASNVENFGTFLLNCCCDILPDLQPTYRVKLATRIWSVIQKGSENSSANFEAMLKVIAMNEDKSLDPFILLEEAKSVGVKLTGTMFFFALLIVCQRGELDAAVKILTMMKDGMIPVNERFFNALMIGNLRSGDLKGATDMLDVMRASKIEPSIHTWITLLHVYIEMEKLDELRETYSLISVSQLTEDQFYELLKAAGRQNNSEILDLVIGWSLKSQKLHTLTVTNLGLQLLHLGHPQNALRIILEFADVLRLRKEHLGTFFIKEFPSANALKDYDLYLSLLTSLQGENRNPYAFSIGAESCLKQKRFDLAYRIFERMLPMNIPVRPHYFLPAFISETQDNGIIGAIKVLQQMNSINIQPDWEMLVNWIIPILFRVEGNLLETLKIIRDASKLSYSSGGLLSAGLIVALQERKLEEGVMIVEKIKGKVLYPESVMRALLLYICDMEEVEKKKEVGSVFKYIKYVSENIPHHDLQDHIGAFIVKLVEVDRGEEANLLLKDIAESQLPVSQTAAEIIMEKLKFEDKLDVNANLYFQQYHHNGKERHLTDISEMDVPSLECHKQELESKGMNARGTSRKLFLKYCARENLEKVLESKLSFEKEFGPISRGMKSALLGAYVRNEVLEPALELLQELTDAREEVSDIVIDVYKIIDLATLMVKNGMIDEAISLILEKCPSRKVHRPEAISRNIVNLLEAVSKSKADFVHTLTQFFLKLRFIKPSNPTLAPSVRDLIRKNNLEAAVERFEEYAVKYSLNPCLQELTYAVFGESSLLKRVIQSSALVRGERDAKRMLALARADVGDIDGAAKDFMELGNDLSFASILKQCEYLSSKNEMGKVLNLIQAIHKTGQNYDCKKLYDIAIQSCKRYQNKDGLQQLLSMMEEQDLYISPKLKEILVKST